MDLQQYARVLRAHWLLIVASVFLCTFAAGLLAWTRPPTYAAQMELYVSSSTSITDASSADTYAAILLSQQRAVSYAPLVASPKVVLGVNKQLGLSLSLQEFRTKVSAARPEGTALINVTVRDRSRRSAKAIADALGKQFPSFVEALETAKGQQNPSVRVVVASPAQLPAGPVAPRKTLYLALGVLLGLVLGTGAAVLREAVDKRIRGEDDAAAAAGAPVLGSIIEDPAAGSRPLIVANDPFSVQAEAYRRLRTNLRVLSVDHNLRSFVVSSAVASEGKTLIVANLGIAFAQAGYRVVLVDADLRWPRLTQVLGISATVGLTNVLVDDMPIEAALQTWPDGLPLEILGSGPKPLNPSELLGSQRFATLLDALTDRADVVILDVPALLPVTDAAIVARVTSGLVLVTRVTSTRMAHLETAAESLRAVDEPVLGVVLNRLPTRRAWRYLSYGFAPDRGTGNGAPFATDAAGVEAEVREREGGLAG
jgi:polysaccharide biosynthesis transport protein